MVVREKEENIQVLEWYDIIIIPCFIRGENMPKVIFEKEYYNVKEISEMLGIDPVTIRGYFTKERMKGREIGNAWYSTQEDIEKFLKTKTKPNRRKK